MLVVTTNDIPGWEIQRVCGEVFGLTVRSRNAFAQMGGHFKSSMQCVSTPPSWATSGPRSAAYGTAVQAVPVTDGAKYTAQQLGYGGGA